MKTVGLIGGLTWLSTLDYYRLLNEKINQRLGGVEAARVIIYSVNFAEIKKMTEEGRWNDMATMLTGIANHLDKAGADCILIGANTMHRIADTIQAGIHIPLINIASVTADAVRKQGLRKVGLLGTKYTMQFDFFKEKLKAIGIETIIPADDDITTINTAIYTEMGKGIFTRSTKEFFLNVIDQLVQQGAEGVILGCTEIPILIKPEDCGVPVFDTTLLHVEAAVRFALEE